MPILTPLGLLFLSCTCTSDQPKKTTFLEDYPMNFPTKIGSKMA